MGVLSFNLGVTVAEIHHFTTDISDLIWVAPIDSGATKPGEPGKHGGNGSKAFHNEIEVIIDNTKSLIEFNQGLLKLIDRWNIDPMLLPPLK